MEEKKQSASEILILTGMSGSGKSVTLKTLEDLGYETIDNLPLALLKSVEKNPRTEYQPLAIGVDVRSQGFSSEELCKILGQMEKTTAHRMVFMDADNEVLALRFNETRRRHPLADDKPLMEGIIRERTLLTPIKQKADQIIDTSFFSSSDLKKYVRDAILPSPSGEMMILLSSFSYAVGIPREADMVFDMRFLENPHYIPELEPMTGEDTPVQDYISKDEAWPPFIESTQKLMITTLPRFKQEGRKYVYIAFGCTGGKHRSVFAASKFSKWLENQDAQVMLTHRELLRNSK